MTKEQLPGGGTVFGIGRRRTQGQLAKVELNQGIGHLKQAATHAARGAGATVGPRVQAARGAVAPTALVVRDRAASGLASTAAALAPLALAVRNVQAEAAGKAIAGSKAAAGRKAALSKKARAKNLKAARRKQKKTSGGMMVGLLAAGTVAGLAGAMALRRRREQQEWTEYEPAQTVEPARDEVDTLIVETPSANGAKPTDSSTRPGGPTGADGNSAATSAPGTQPVIQPNDKVPSVAEGARDVSGRPADDLTTALGKEKTARSGSRR
ncbi:hypothetical protein OOK41_03270 [Micromonospora sp. NBC_01655]|uniref:hypothetical protein n=1 Tax=Micromonospora sp. NBC_01655 TaxID=2975983 RepID=UPI002250D93A|nr:hypothetical protein [Micromonospora sp. NBC_01655]MCX4469346.1 hypothetical protein [Micromonospora sp. NBC_01655]